MALVRPEQYASVRFFSPTRLAIQRHDGAWLGDGMVNMNRSQLKEGPAVWRWWFSHSKTWGDIVSMEGFGVDAVTLLGRLVAEHGER